MCSEVARAPRPNSAQTETLICLNGFPLRQWLFYAAQSPFSVHADARISKPSSCHLCNFPYLHAYAKRMPFLRFDLSDWVQLAWKVDYLWLINEQWEGINEGLKSHMSVDDFWCWSLYSVLSWWNTRKQCVGHWTEATSNYLISDKIMSFIVGREIQSLTSMRCHHGCCLFQAYWFLVPLSYIPPQLALVGHEIPSITPPWLVIVPWSRLITELLPLLQVSCPLLFFLYSWNVSHVCVDLMVRKSLAEV